MHCIFFGCIRCISDYFIVNGTLQTIGSGAQFSSSAHMKKLHQIETTQYSTDTSMSHFLSIITFLISRTTDDPFVYSPFFAQIIFTLNKIRQFCLFKHSILVYILHSNHFYFELKKKTVELFFRFIARPNLLMSIEWRKLCISYCNIYDNSTLRFIKLIFVE